MFFDFVMERTQEGKQEAMAAALEKHFKPPQEGSVDPDAFTKGIEVIISMLKTEAVLEFQKMMNPFGDTDENEEAPEIRNMLEQPNKLKWKDNTPDVSNVDKFKCDCWNTKCPNFGDCRKCIVYEMCLKRLPTCEMDLFEELKQHYVAWKTDAVRSIGYSLTI